MFTLGRSIDIAMATSEINAVKARINQYLERVDTYHAEWYGQAVRLGSKIGSEEYMPRLCSIQTHRSNTPANTAEEYYRRIITLPMVSE